MADPILLFLYICTDTKIIYHNPKKINLYLLDAVIKRTPIKGVLIMLYEDL